MTDKTDKPTLERLYDDLADKKQELGRLMVSYLRMKDIAEGSAPINPELDIPDSIQDEWKKQLVPIANDQGQRILEIWLELHKLTQEAADFIKSLDEGN